MFCEQSAEQPCRNTVPRNSVKGAIKLSAGRNKDETRLVRRLGNHRSRATVPASRISRSFPSIHRSQHPQPRHTTNGTSREQSVSMSARQARPVDGCDYNEQVCRSDAVKMSRGISQHHVRRQAGHS